MLRANQLQAIAESPAPVLTVYINTQNRNAFRHPRLPDDLVWFRKEAVSLSRTLLPRDAEELHREVARVEQFLDGRHPEEKALAIFAGRKTWTVLPLHTSIDNEIRWGKPAIGQLFRLLGEHNSYGVAVLDHHAVRFFQFLLGELTELGEKSYDIDESQWKRKDVGRVASERTRKAHGSDQDLVERRLEAQYERLFRETADEVIALFKNHNLAVVFLVGPERLVGPLRKKFSSAFQARVVSVLEDLGKLSPSEIFRRLEPVMADYERKQQIAAVELLLAADYGSVTDVDETLARFQNGAIRVLVVAPDHDFQLRECTKCGAVSRSGDDACAPCGGKRRNIALLEILPGLATEHGTKVEFVTGEAAQILAKAGGIAGWLRQPKRTAAG
jgi:Bacterial archaeo-eukaryotic release factor family 10